MIEAVIFDAGGVIHNDLNPMIATHRDIAQTLGISQEEESVIWQETHPRLGEGKITEEEFWQEFLTKSKSKAQLPDESLLLREYKKNFNVFEEVLDIVRNLKRNGIKVALLSNTIQPHADFNNEAGIYSEFFIRILSHEVGLRKPDPRIYLLVLKKLNITPQKTIYIDDKMANVKAARKLGIHAIQYLDPNQLRTDLQKLGTKLN